MTTPNQAWWTSARQARDRLAAQVISHPNVSMIDIGRDPEGASTTPVLRVHIRSAGAALPRIPHEVDHIPVRILRGDYQLEQR